MQTDMFTGAILTPPTAAPHPSSSPSPDAPSSGLHTRQPATEPRDPSFDVGDQVTIAGYLHASSHYASVRGSGVDEKVIDMPWIDLVPLTDDERELFIAEDLADYAAQIERDEALSRQDAIARAHDELSVSVRDGHATAAERGHRRFTALDGSGVSVGWLWVTPFPDHKGRSRAFLYQITVRP